MGRLIDADNIQKKIESWCWKHEEYNQDDLNELCEIVPNAEEEFCEWKYFDTTSYNANIQCLDKVRNIKAMKNYNYCPYCGKKIKVVE